MILTITITIKNNYNDSNNIKIALIITIINNSIQINYVAIYLIDIHVSKFRRKQELMKVPFDINFESHR